MFASGNRSGRFFVRTALVVILGLVTGAAAVLAYNRFAGQSSFTVPGLAQGPATSTTSGGTAFASNIALPSRLQIPVIGVDAPVHPVGVNAQGNMAAPTSATWVGWYASGTRPGFPGSAVIDGHLDIKGVPQAVFYDLDKLKAGDEVDIVDASGTKIVFAVTSVASVPYDASTTNIFSSADGNSYLNLITCTGDWVPEKKIYNERLVVYAKKK